MPIQTQCTWCGKKINAGDAFAGKSVKCPGCGGVIKIPTADGPALPLAQDSTPFGAQPPVGPPSQSNYGPPSGFPPQAPQQFPPPGGPPAGGIYDVQDMSQPMGPPPEQQGVDRRPCPACGELIMRDAIKCRFCGEVFDSSFGRTGSSAGSAADDDMSGLDWFMAILGGLCCWIGCIVGVVYLIQGKKKGGKMLGISICFAIGWSVIWTVLQEVLKNVR